MLVFCVKHGFNYSPKVKWCWNALQIFVYSLFDYLLHFKLYVNFSEMFIFKRIFKQK